MIKTIFITLHLLTTVIFSQMENNIKYLALGDSYTIGEGVNESERFPVQLSNKLNKLGFAVDQPIIIAKSGWTTDELSSALDEKEPMGKYDFVTLLIGVNNQYRGRDTEEFRKEFIQLLNRAAGYTHSFMNVIVVSIPNWGLTPFAIEKERDPETITKEIELFNSIAKEESKKVNAHFVNITDFSKLAVNDLTLLADDKLHPSEKMYSLWVERILPIAQLILTKA